MTRKTRQQEGPQSAQMTAEQMRAAIPRLRKRIAELAAFDVMSVQDRGDPRIQGLENALEATITDTFGPNTIEYHRYLPGSLDTASIYFGHATPLSEVRQGYARGISRATTQLASAIEWFEEKLAERPESHESKAARTFQGLDLHPDLAARVGPLFEGGHYAHAVEDACKVLKLRVQLLSKSELDGTNLMMTVFSANNPVLRFNELKSQTDKDEQQGMMHLYAGAMLALRNPRAHDLLDDDPEQALEYIAFINMLVKALSRTRAES